MNGCFEDYPSLYTVVKYYLERCVSGTSWKSVRGSEKSSKPGLGFGRVILQSKNRIDAI